MNETDIYIKTPVGLDEVRARSRKLAPRLRTMLIMVDGTLNVSQLRVAAATLGAPEDFLQVLEAQGLVQAEVSAPVRQAGAAPSLTRPALSGPERFRAAQKFMNDSAVDALGLRAFFFTLKLERCYNLADLRALLPEFGKAVLKGAGPGVARVLEARARDMLA